MQVMRRFGATFAVLLLGGHIWQLGSNNSVLHHQQQVPATTERASYSLKHLFCTRSQIRNGSWQSVRIRKPPYTLPSDSQRCYGQLLNASLYPYWDTYEWIPKESSCVFPKWNTTEFCKVLHARPNLTKILFVGDSIMREQYMALVGLFGWYGNKHYIFREGDYTICKTNHTDSSSGIHVRYQRDYMLDNLTIEGGWLPTFNPQLVILNRGIHYDSNRTNFDNEISKKIADLQRWHNSSACSTHNHCLAIWKTSVPGHPRCYIKKGRKITKDYLTPNNNITAMENLVADSSLYKDTETYKKWGWWAQKQQNEVVLKKFRKSSLPFLQIMDSYHFQIARPDGHRADQGDCLHNCLPGKGKVEVLNQILFHILQMQAQEQVYDDDDNK